MRQTIKNAILFSLTFLLLLISDFGNAAILIEENGKVVHKVQDEEASHGFEFRKKRKVGFGVAGAGVWGMLGAHIDLNFSPAYTLHGGVGTGEGFQTFAVQVRKYIPGQSFLPYVSGGIARWYTTGNGKGPIKSSTPGFLASRFLNDREKETGIFSEVFIFPSIGIQYYQLNGEWRGSSIFAEINLLIDIDDIVVSPTGTIGYTRFF